MATGIEMMMKSFGIDPEKIKADLKLTFDTTVEAVKTEQKEIKDTLARVELKLDKVLEIRGSFDSMNVVENEPLALQHVTHETERELVTHG